MDKKEKYKKYQDLLIKWQDKINLIGQSTIQEIENRHFEDSRQLINFLKDKDETIVDLGSGAGFPGMVLAIEGYTNIHLIESDQRKSIFLQNVSRETLTPVKIHNDRIENVNLKANTITCRAFAPIAKSLKISKNLTKNDTKYLFLKSDNYQEELTEAEKDWYFDVAIYPSQTDSRGRIVLLSNILPR